MIGEPTKNRLPNPIHGGVWFVQILSTAKTRRLHEMPHTAVYGIE
jgi:hypothetical protein